MPGAAAPQVAVRDCNTYPSAGRAVRVTVSPLLGGGLVGGDRPVLRRWHCDSIGGDLLDGEHPWEVRDVGIVVPIGDGRPGSLDGHRSGFAHVRGGHIGEAGGLGQGVRSHQAGDGVVRRREGGDGVTDAGGFVFDLDGEGGRGGW